MKEVLVTNNVVLISYVQDLLKAHGIEAALFDQNASILEGSIGILPRRVMVIDEDHTAACRLMREAGLAEEMGEACAP